VEFPSSVNVNDENGTEVLASKFAEEVKNGQVIVLNGNLGSGKTFFIKMVLKSLSIQNVRSPSFAIVNEYNGKFKFYHFDFYRLKKIEELYDIGWVDYLNNSGAAIFIEWGELLEAALPEKRIEILITVIDDTKRKFEFRKYD